MFKQRITMDKRKQKMFLIVGTLMLFACATAKATNPDSVLAEDVFSRLIAICEKPDNMLWPPVLIYEESPDINAFAFLNETQPFVVVHSALVKELLNSDADRLAFVIGHELAHVTLGHVKKGHADTKFKTVIFSREDEIAADMKGMQYAIKAGYSYKTALKGVQNAIKLGMEYSSYEGLGADHPSWKERLTYLDKEQAQLWKSMAAFENGNLFLAFEQYLPAERCFRFVTQEFPSCYEAWANLGYALLMRYCDGLQTEDIIRFGIGHLVTGGFYSRTQTLEQMVRGADEDLWWDAVGALREAHRLNAESTVAKANLGIAYLVRPDGKDIGQAIKFLGQAAEEAERDTLLDVRIRMTILLNAGVMDVAGAAPSGTTDRFEKAERLGRAFTTTIPLFRSYNSFVDAIAYNRATMLLMSGTKEDSKAAAKLLEGYLTRMPTTTLWWPIAYQNYVNASKAAEMPAKDERELKAASRDSKRMVVSLQLDKDKSVALNDAMVDVRKSLGAMQIIPVAGRTNLMRYVSEERGMEILGGSNVIAIFLRGHNAPVIPLRSIGFGTKTNELKIGMTKESVDELLEDQDFSFGELIDPEKKYRFYRDLGLAVSIRKDIVQELVIAVLPQ